MDEIPVKFVGENTLDELDLPIKYKCQVDGCNGISSVHYVEEIPNNSTNKSTWKRIVSNFCLEHYFLYKKEKNALS